MAHHMAEPKTKSRKEIETIIDRAIKKVGAKRASDICRYIPMTSGGYMHHFTFKKKRSKQPDELGTMIEKFIMSVDRPSRVAPKQRAKRGLRKRRELQVFTRAQLEKMIQLANAAGDSELAKALSPSRPLTVCKRELIASIRRGQVDQALWQAYVEAVEAHLAIQNNPLLAQVEGQK